jgi:broad specificity phosphatase PhoE
MPSTNYLQQIVILRHGETDQDEALDLHTPLNENGHRQAVAAGQEFTLDWLWNATIHCSSHLRCRQTYNGMRENEAFSHTKVIFDPLLREVDYGPGTSYLDIEYELKCQERKRVGKFYYHFKNGESPADAYVRGCLFWESAQRQAYRTGKKNLLVITHGMMARLLIMRYMHWTPDDYERMHNLKNCVPVVISRDGMEWKVEGLVMD